MAAWLGAPRPRDLLARCLPPGGCLPAQPPRRDRGALLQALCSQPSWIPAPQGHTPLCPLSSVLSCRSCSYRNPPCVPRTLLCDPLSLSLGTPVLGASRCQPQGQPLSCSPSSAQLTCACPHPLRPARDTGALFTSWATQVGGRKGLDTAADSRDRQQRQTAETGRQAAETSRDRQKRQADRQQR